MSEDVIRVTGIKAFGYHGVLREERSEGQQFTADVEIVVDVSEAAASDDLSMTVDYSAVAHEAVAVLEGEPRQLIETVAEEIARRVLSHRTVRSTRVTVHKPDAPVGVPFTDVSVTVVRQR